MLDQYNRTAAMTLHSDDIEMRGLFDVAHVLGCFIINMYTSIQVQRIAAVSVRPPALLVELLWPCLYCARGVFLYSPESSYKQFFSQASVVLGGFSFAASLQSKD